MRGLAIAAVVAHHAGLLRGGSVGVDLFFVLSGFLITTLLLDEHAATSRISLRRFYLRRARRLMPSAAAGVAVFVAVGAAPLASGITALLYTQNLHLIVHPADPGWLVHYWSLSQEEQFYFLWPPLLVWLLRRKIAPKRLVVALVGLAAAVIVHRLTTSGFARFYYGPDTHADGIVLGCAFAVARNAGLVRAGRALRVAGLLAAVAWLVDAAMVRSEISADRYSLTLASLASLAIVASVVLEPDALLARLMRIRPLCWLGLISYSVYIWQPLASAAGLRGLPLIAVAVAVGFLMFRLIERPFRYLPARLPSPAAAEAVV